MKYYHVRINLIGGMLLDGYACLGLAKSVAVLDRLTGKAWPYQVIHRALKTGNCWAQAYEQPAVTSPPGKTHVARCVVVSIEDAGQNPYPELRNPDEPQPLCSVCQLPRQRAENGWHSCFTCGPVAAPAAGPPVAKYDTTQPFTLPLFDAALVAMWVPEIIEKGVPKSDAAVFKRLEKTLLSLLKLANYAPFRRK